MFEITNIEKNADAKEKVSETTNRIQLQKRSSSKCNSKNTCYFLFEYFFCD